jgi:hypothetical protein
MASVARPLCLAAVITLGRAEVHGAWPNRPDDEYTLCIEQTAQSRPSWCYTCPQVPRVFICDMRPIR